MKIFNQVQPWPYKVNFIDHNNVGVGYDMQQSCCEHADWFISKTEQEDINGGNFRDDLSEEQLRYYTFDINYFVEVDAPGLDEGGMVRFKLNNLHGEVAYLHLFNSHNGYYGHGFVMTTPSRAGSL